MNGPTDVVVTVTRRVDDQWITYQRLCPEEQLDGVLATEENHPGRIVSLVVSPPQG